MRKKVQNPNLEFNMEVDILINLPFEGTTLQTMKQNLIRPFISDKTNMFLF